MPEGRCKHSMTGNCPAANNALQCAKTICPGREDSYITCKVCEEAYSGGCEQCRRVK
jgi:hypothetical protein